jgi:polyhydroxyalkanoate synthesis regulator phasin
VDQLQSQLTESTQQRASVDQRLEQLDVARQALEARLHEEQELARSERESLMEHARSVEDRAAREVDQARQQAKDLQTRLNSATRKHSDSEAALSRQLSVAQSTAAIATQAADTQRGKIEALEQQLSTLRDLPAQLEAAFKRNQEQKPPTKTRTKRQKS